MSIYEDLKQFKDNPPEEKLAILRAEMLTPLASIKGYASLLKMQVDSTSQELPNDSKEYLDVIIKSAEHLKMVLDALTGS